MPPRELPAVMERVLLALPRRIDRRQSEKAIGALATGQPEGIEAGLVARPYLSRLVQRGLAVSTLSMNAAARLYWATPAGLAAQAALEAGKETP